MNPGTEYSPKSTPCPTCRVQILEGRPHDESFCESVIKDRENYGAFVDAADVVELQDAFGPDDEPTQPDVLAACPPTVIQVYEGDPADTEPIFIGTWADYLKARGEEP